ncbi:MAG: DUF192 domain-containing protein [candidate division NC10 bacterium]|nr:DUF192 domain-containing protein [candidate division NC10 bacterium]
MMGRAGIWLVLLMLVALAAPAPPVGGVEVNPPLPTAPLVIAGRVNLTVEIARKPEEHIRGLSGRPGLKPGHGMLFWMKDMRFSLDIVWIRDGRIVKIEKHAPPLTPTRPERIYTAMADLVLEVPAGFTDRKRIRVGNTVQATLP